MFNLVLRPIAAKEYEEAVQWYADRNTDAAKNFIFQVEATLDTITTQPLSFKKLYKDYREATTKRYPYCIVYFIDEERHNIVVVAIYHHKRDPKKKYRK